MAQLMRIRAVYVHLFIEWNVQRFDTFSMKFSILPSTDVQYDDFGLIEFFCNFLQISKAMETTIFFTVLDDATIESLH